MVATDTYSEVNQAVRKAYADCWGTGARAFESRELMFRSPHPVSRDEAIRILGDAIPCGYNAFRASVLTYLPYDCNVTIAREYSVCVYVDGIILERPYGLGCDEFDHENGQTRIWWD